MKHDLKVASICFALAFAMWLAKPALAGETPTPEPPTFTPTPTLTPTDTPTPATTPTPTATPGWDKSSIVVSAACVEGAPVFTILNHGAAMTGPSNYWLLNISGGAADCAADTADLPPSGTFQLDQDQSVDIPFVNAGEPPYRICVEQRPGHPGTGYASATAVQSPDCVTAEDVVDEDTVRPVWRIFAPAIKR